MFKSRLELISYFLWALTGADRAECDKEALKYEHKTFVVKFTND